MSKSYTRLHSPLGKLLVVIEGGNVSGLYQERQPNTPEEGSIGAADPSLRFHPVASALHSYFNGSPGSIDIPLALSGTPFQKKVWAAILDIPYGHTATYKEVAATIGSPKSVRAVANAVANNPITVIVPCHRVISQNGDVKYSGGEKNKRYLLALEAGRKR